MNISWLVTFKEVAKVGNYTKVADALFISQPAVSQQIRQLERFFGVRLFQRFGRALELTEAGKIVFDLACRIEDDLECTRERVRAHETDSDKVVTVAGGSTTLLYYMPSVLTQFWAQNPNIAVRTIAKPGPEIANIVKARGADMGIHSSVWLDSSLVASLLCVNPIVAVSSKLHPLAQATDVPAQEVANYRIALTRRASVRKLTEAWFAERSVALNKVMDVSSQEEVLAAARANLAIGFVNKAVAADDFAADNITELSIGGFRLSIPMYVTHRRDLTSSARLLMGYLSSFKPGLADS